MFLIQLNWLLFRPSAGLNPEPLNLCFISMAPGETQHWVKLHGKLPHAKKVTVYAIGVPAVALFIVLF